MHYIVGLSKRTVLRPDPRVLRLQRFTRDLLDLPLPCPLATSDKAIMQPRDLLKMTRWVWVFMG